MDHTGRRRLVSALADSIAQVPPSLDPTYELGYC